MTSGVARAARLAIAGVAGTILTACANDNRIGITDTRLSERDLVSLTCVQPTTAAIHGGLHKTELQSDGPFLLRSDVALGDPPPQYGRVSSCPPGPGGGGGGHVLSPVTVMADRTRHEIPLTWASTNPNSWRNAGPSFVPVTGRSGNGGRLVHLRDGATGSTANYRDLRELIDSIVVASGDDEDFLTEAVTIYINDAWLDGIDITMEDGAAFLDDIDGAAGSGALIPQVSELSQPGPRRRILIAETIRKLLSAARRGQREHSAEAARRRAQGQPAEVTVSGNNGKVIRVDGVDINPTQRTFGLVEHKPSNTFWNNENNFGRYLRNRNNALLEHIQREGGIWYTDGLGIRSFLDLRGWTPLGPRISRYVPSP